MKNIYSLLKKAPAAAKLAWVFAILFSLNASQIWGQTNPGVLHNLSTGSWTLTGWNSGVAAGRYPGNGATGANTTTGVVIGVANANMMFWTGAENPALPALPTGNYAGNYSATSASRINGLGTNGFSMVMTGGAGQGRPNSAVLALNATGRQNIAVQWTAGTVAQSDGTPTPREHRIRLQYKIGVAGAWTDVPGPIEYTSAGKAAGHSQNMGNTTLPAACNNQAILYVRWVYYQHAANNGGSRANLRIDDITVSSSATGCAAPATQASSLTFSSVGSNSLTLNWTNGNGAGRVILAKAASAVDANPANGSNPTANLAFGSGTQVGTGNFTVFNGIGGGPINITGLNPNTTYHFRVYEYCSPDRVYNVNTATNNPNSTTTPCATPTTQASSIVFSSVSSNQFTLNWTNGNGNGRVVLIKQGSAVDANPTDGSNPTANLAFGSGTQIGTGNYTVFNGVGSGPITVTGLAANTTYHVRVYEFCTPTRNYNTNIATGNPNSQLTTAAAVPTLSANTLTAFGSQCINGTFGPNSFTITGVALTTANVTVASLTGYEFATAAGGPYSSSLSLIQPGGAYSQAIFVRFIPTAAIAYNGNIVVGGAGASNINVVASGTGINGTPSVTTVTATSILTTTASSGGNTLSTTCGTISNKGVVWGTAANPTVPSANSTDDGTGTAPFTSSITGLTAGTTYNYRAYAINSNLVTSYGTNLTFTTLSLEPTAHAASLTVTAPTTTSLTLNFSAANTITNANGYIILRRIGAAPTGLPLDATGYTVGNTIGDATVAAIISSTAATSTIITGLSGGTNYHFTLIPYGYNGSNAASYNYLTSPTIPTANGTTLYSLSPAAGDVAFTAFQTSAPDGVEFITLRRLDLRQVTVTDNGILSTNAMRTGEGTYQFPNTSTYADIPAGTIIRLDEALGTDDTDFTEGVIHLRGNGSTVLGVGSFALSTDGDQVIMYTGSAAAPSFIAGIAGAAGVAAWDNVNGATSANTSKAPGTASDYYMGTSDNGYYNSSVTGNANAIRTSAITTGNWTISTSAQADRFINKNILFNESNFSAGSMSISGVTTTSMTVDVSGVSFTDESASATRYAVVIRAGAAPTAPVDRYTCYAGTLSDLTANFGTDPTVKSATTDVCAGTDGNGKVVYLGYAKPSALVINGLTGGTTYHIGVYAVNGNGRSANFSSTGLVQTQATNAALSTLTTTALSAITTTTANSGGDISSDGGSAVTARGIVWNTIINPVLPGLGSTSNGTGIGSFTSNITALTPETNYHVRAYATNTAGTAYGNNISFYTLSNPPDVQATNLVGNPLSSTSIELAWDAADFPASGATVQGYVLLRANAPAMPTFVSNNGQAPAAGVGVVVSSSIIYPAATFANTGLAASTTYNYLLIPYCWDGSNPETFHYLTSGAPTAAATTLASSCTAPTVQASNVTISGVTTSGFVVNWTAGNGNRSLVVVRANAPVTAVPSEGTGYTASANFGLGSAISPGEFVVYNSTASALTVSGLAANTNYHVAVYTFNISGNCYLVSSPAVNNAITLPSVSIIETFEPGTKAAYLPAANATCNLGVWNFNDALIGTTAQDKKNGTRSARLINNGSITMQFDKSDGVGTITVQHAAFSVDGASDWVLEVSNNGGASFDAFVSAVYTTNTTTLTPTVVTANVTGNVRIRIRKISGGSNRMNIDDIAMTNFVPANTIATGAITGSPYCITDASGSTISVPFTATGLFNEENVFIAQLSNASGNFSTPVEIGTLTAMASGTINAEIPAGTPSGTSYRIRVISSSPGLSGSNNGSNLQVFLNAPDLVNFFADVVNGSSVNLNWANPGSCFDEILIVGRVGSFVTAIPTGDGSAYTANSVYGTGGSGANLPAGEFAVYKNTAGTSVTLTGMTAGTTYFFEALTRKGTLWSNGVIISVTPFNPVAGDFRSITSGNYSNASTWQTYNGSTWVAATTYPNSAGSTSGTANVTIRSPHTVTLDASRANQPINNLIVQAGARIWANDSTFNGNRYLTVYGNISCNGNIGNAFNKYDNISFNIEGNPTTISGSGSFNASRLRKHFNVNQTSEIIIAMNVGLKFASGVGSSSGTCIYNNQSGDYTLNLTINENVTVDLLTSVGSSGNISIDGINGEGSGERNGTFTINGTLNVPGTMFVMTNNLVQPVSFIIGTSGVVNCVNVCTANSGSTDVVLHSGSQTAGATLRILNGGRLNLTGGLPSDANTYNKPFSIRTNNASPFTFAAGLGVNNNTFDFQPGSIVEYSSTSGTMPVQSQVLTYSNLLISGAATKTINSTLNVNRNLTIASPAVLNPSGFDINLGGDWNNYGTAGFTETSGGTVIFNGTQEQNMYCPGGENFNNVSISNSSTEGLILRNNATIANNINLGSDGRLFFGPSPSIVTLLNMADASNTLLGSGTALIDMTGANHILNIGCENPDFSGTFDAGDQSIVNYNRDASVSTTTGNQNIRTDWTYANLNLTGSDDKISNDDFTVNRNLLIDGATTELHANTVTKKLNIGGDITLNAGASFENSCFDNLTIETFGDEAQTYTGNGNPILCYNFRSDKAGAGSLTLASNTAVNAKNNFRIKHTGTSGQFSDGGNTITLGDDLSLTGVAARFNFTGTLVMTGENGDSNDIGDENDAICQAQLNNLTIQGSGPNNNTRIRPNVGNQALTIKQNLTIQNGNFLIPGILRTQNNNINIGGNWVSYGQAGFLEGTSMVQFNGSTNQHIETAGGEEFYNLQINNAAGITLLSNTQARNQLSMTQGNINPGVNLLTLGENVTNPGLLNYTSGRVLGSMRRWFAPAINSGISTSLFPIGNISFERHVSVEYTTAPSLGGTLTATFMEEDMALSGVPANNINIPATPSCPAFLATRLSNEGYWKMDDANGLTGGEYLIALEGEGFNNIIDICELTALKRVGSGDWSESGVHEEPIGSAAHPILKRSVASGWSNWGFGAGDVNPLPVQLLDFNAQAENNEVVKLVWVTASEINNDYFTVERSIDAINFTSILTQQGAGNSNSVLTYLDFDRQPFNGVSYYRLKQTDFNGDYTYSNIVAVHFNTNPAFDVLAFGNLNNSETAQIKFLNTEKPIQIDIIDVSGRIVFSEHVVSKDIQEVKLINLQNFKQGLYLLRFTSGEMVVVKRWVR